MCVLLRDGLERSEYLEFFIAHRIGVQRVGRFHRHQTQQLQQVVLHHVAQRAGVVVIVGTAFHAQAFGHGDLHVVDVRGIPQRLEQDVGKTQCHQVLHRFLAQVMIDAIDAILREHRADGLVERVGRGQITPQRFFDDHAALRQAETAQAFADRAEVGRGGGQVIDLFQGGVRGEHCGQIAPAGI